MKEIIRFFDCFAGIGGFYCGANQIKSDKYEFRHVAYCEIDKSAQRFYDVACSSDGIQKIQDVKDIKTKKNSAGTEVVDFDILFAGFPCQSFLMLGIEKASMIQEDSCSFTFLICWITTDRSILCLKMYKKFIRSRTEVCLMK